MSQGDFEAPVLAPEGPSEVGKGSGPGSTSLRAGRTASRSGGTRSGSPGLIIVAFNVFVAIFGPYIWRVDPNELVGLRLQDPSWAHPMGTDELGRDTLARIIHGAQVSLQVGIISVSLALVIGLTLGLLSGFFGGKVDTRADALSSTSCSRCPGSCSRS